MRGEAPNTRRQDQRGAERHLINREGLGDPHKLMEVAARHAEAVMENVRLATLFKQYELIESIEAGEGPAELEKVVKRMIFENPFIKKQIPSEFESQAEQIAFLLGTAKRISELKKNLN